MDIASDADRHERVDAVEKAVGKALYDNMIGGYEVVDTEAGLTILGPVEPGHSRDIFVVRVLTAKLEVAG